MTKEESGRFLTANFFLSDELESVSSQKYREREATSPLEHTMIVLHEEMDILKSENLQTFQRFSNLCTLILLAAKKMQQVTQNLRRSREEIMDMMATQKNDFEGFQAKLLSVVRGVPDVLKQEVKEALALAEAEHQKEVAELKCKMLQLQCDMDEVQSELDHADEESEKEMKEAEAEHEITMSAAVTAAQEQATMQMTVEHDLELNTVKKGADSRVEEMRLEVEAQKGTIEELTCRVEDLKKEIERCSAQASAEIEAYKSEAQQTEEKLTLQRKELEAKHELELKVMISAIIVLLSDFLLLFWMVAARSFSLHCVGMISGYGEI